MGQIADTIGILERPGAQPWSGSFGLPPKLLRRARGRLRAFTVLILGMGVVYETFDLLHRRADDPPLSRPTELIILAATACLYLATRSSLAHVTVLRVGLVYEVLVCLLLNFRINLLIYEAYGHIPHATFAALVMMLYPLLVPSPPAVTLITAVSAAATSPVSIWLIENVEGLSMGSGAYVDASVVPVLATGMAVFASRIVHGMSKEVAEAHRMGSYVLVEKLGAGAMGEVWKAKHRSLARPAAIKLLRPDNTNQDALARFEQEAQQTCKLSHPNTVSVYDFGRTDDGRLYYVMELLEGASLQRIVEVVGPQSPGRVVHIIRHIADALSEAHGVGLIHRDVKPANVFLCNQGGVPDTPKLLDFGLVKQLESQDQQLQTREGIIVGTPLYMAPETMTSPAESDARADLYSLGAVAYFLLTGEHVFSGKTAIEVCNHHMTTAPTPPSERLGRPLPKELEQLILQCLEKSPEARPQSAAELSHLLDTHSTETWTTLEATEWWEEYGSALH